LGPDFFEDTAHRIEAKVLDLRFRLPGLLGG
jgi:hypothetical protein